MDISEVQAVQIVCLINQGLSQQQVAITLAISNNFNNVWFLVKKIKMIYYLIKILLVDRFFCTSVILFINFVLSPIDVEVFK